MSRTSDESIPVETGILPVVARPRSGLPGWSIAVFAAVLAILLFTMLDGRRRALSAPVVRPRIAEAIGTTASTTPLYIPPEAVSRASVIRLARSAPPSARTPVVYRAVAPAAEPITSPMAQTTPAQFTHPQPEIEATPTRLTTDAALVIDATVQAPILPSDSSAEKVEEAPTTLRNKLFGARASAGALANRATTVPQGTLIPAVLETALDSTRPGLARAIVSRDVHGFDGSRVLIPRGSRLIGEYDADVQAGQNRLLVNWERLIRPDGSTIAIGSPASDAIGRGGLRAKVDSHFFERFGGAILQSALNIGANLAARRADAAVVVALPNALQGATAPLQAPEVRPTLKVKRASSISVFVARDLDFTGVERR